MNRLIIPKSINDIKGNSKEKIRNPFADALAFLIFVFSSYLSGISTVEPNHIQKRIKETIIYIPDKIRKIWLDVISENLVIYSVFL